MAEEARAEPGALVRAFDQAGNVGHHELAVADLHHAQPGMQRGEGIVGDLGPRVEVAARNVDLPALGRPTRPMSAISFSRSQTQRSSPGQPLSARRGARLVELL